MEKIKAPSGAVYAVNRDFDGRATAMRHVPEEFDGLPGVVRDADGRLTVTVAIPMEDIMFLAEAAWREKLIHRVREGDPVLFPALAALLIAETRVERGVRDGR